MSFGVEKTTTPKRLSMTEFVLDFSLSLHDMVDEVSTLMMVSLIDEV